MPAYEIEVFDLPNGEWQSALLTRRGRVVWQSSPCLLYDEATAVAVRERIRRFGSSSLDLGDENRFPPPE